MHAKKTYFSAGYLFGLHDFTPYFHFRCVACATFDRNLIHSADACFLMACVGYTRAATVKTLSSLLNPFPPGSETILLVNWTVLL